MIVENAGYLGHVYGDFEVGRHRGKGD
jgi:hypothetical protein